MATTKVDRQVGGAQDLSEVHERFGKADLVASLLGMLTGLGMLVFLSALIAAGADRLDYQLNIVNPEGELDEASVIGLVIAGAVVFVSFLVGGFAAGRISRFSGGFNGFGSALWLILLVAVFAALGAFVGAEYNAFNRVDLPNWFAQIDVEDLTVMAAVASGTLVLLTLLGGYLGGRFGEAYNRRVDAAIVQAARKEV